MSWLESKEAALNELGTGPPYLRTPSASGAFTAEKMRELFVLVEKRELAPLENPAVRAERRPACPPDGSTVEPQEGAEDPFPHRVRWVLGRYHHFGHRGKGVPHDPPFERKNRIG